MNSDYYLGDPQQKKDYSLVKKLPAIFFAFISLGFMAVNLYFIIGMVQDIRYMKGEIEYYIGNHEQVDGVMYKVNDLLTYACKLAECSPPH